MVYIYIRCILPKYYLYIFYRFTKGPLYNKDELKLYLTQRVKTVLQRKVKKIRKLHEEEQLIEKKCLCMCIDGCNNKESIIQRRAKEIDPYNEFVENIYDIKNYLFIDSLFIFWTYSPPAEIAARIERAAVKLGTKINIKPKENLVKILLSDILSERI